ncbi:MAG: hypothetical protein KKC76_09480 [Proteobacteria bacterium]|nr:hypothetical protein [Pseudomonadota bacterium]MBU4297358.1 hypothetical protein [Pseudomonadota bacterium]MCG2748943.1 hypothetical protein [Desulfobulbaceae bacterium]
MRKFSVFSLLALFVLPVQNGMADDFRVIPYAAIREEYSDNIFFSDDIEQDDFITTGTVGLEVRERTELLKAALVTRFDGLSYADNSELNDVEEYYKGSVTYQLNPFLKMSADAGYSVDSRADRDLDVTGYVLTADVRRRQDYSFSGDYQASEKTSLFTSYSYLDDQFETSDVDEFTGQNVLAGLTHSLDFTKPTAARLYGRYSHYNFYSSKADNYSVTVGFSRQFSEKLSYVFDIGPRYTEGSEKRTGETSYDNGVGGQFTLTYNEELTTAEMNIFHEVTGSSGRDGATKRTGLVLSLKHRISERSFVRFGIDSYLNKATRDAAYVSDLNELTTTLTPSLHYEFNPELFCETAYRYTVIADREADHEKHRNLVFVKLTYKYPVVE